MNAIELKNKLIDHIKASTDTELLEGLYNYLAQDESSREVYQLSDKQSDIVEEVREQIKRGEFLTDEESSQAVEKCISQ